MLPDDVRHDLRTRTRAQIERRLTPRKARTAIARGELVPVLPGKYAPREHAQAFAVRAHAACEWGGAGAVIGGSAALFVWGALDQPPARILVVARVTTRAPTMPWLQVRRRSGETPSADWNGVAIALPQHALIQHYEETEAPSDAAAFAALARGIATSDEVRAVLASRARVRGRTRIERVIRAFDRGAESYLEMVAHRDVFPGAEFADLIPQHRVRPFEHTYRLDLYESATRTAIELDGAAFHGSSGQRARDLRRDAELLAVGIATLRLTYADVTQRPLWCRETARAVIASRVRRESSG